MKRPSILFVCLGNICRSPLAEFAFRAAAERAGLDADIESAGTGTYHLGYAPDPRAQAVARKAGLDMTAKRARRVTPDDFRRFTHIVAMDRENLADLEAMRPKARQPICRCCWTMFPAAGRAHRGPVLRRCRWLRHHLERRDGRRGGARCASAERPRHAKPVRNRPDAPV